MVRLESRLEPKIRKLSQTIRRDLLAAGLIPLTELENNPQCPPWFSLAAARKRAYALDKDISDFFYSPGNTMEPYYYHKNLVLVGFSPDEPDLKESLNKHEEACLKALYRKDFTSLFHGIIDRRIALTAYQHLFDMIPDEDKYELFLHVYCRSESGFRDFPEDIVRRAAQCRKEPLRIPGVDKNGFVDIYRGMTSKSTPLARAFSWTLKLRTAICFAIRFRLDREIGEVFKVTVHQDNIVAYITERKEDEVIVLPSNIKAELEAAEKINIIGWQDLEPELEVRGITERFQTWSSYLKPEYFRNPTGIHGISHTKRVLFLCLILAYRNNMDAQQTDVLCKAALYHDIGRTHDNADPLHGQKSYQKAMQLNLLECDNSQEKRVIQFIIENHCIDDETARNKLLRCSGVDFDQAWLLYSVFKDADGLDRVRLRDLDIKQLRTPTAKDLILLAEQLLERIKS